MASQFNAAAAAAAAAKEDMGKDGAPPMLTPAQQLAKLQETYAFFEDIARQNLAAFESGLRTQAFMVPSLYLKGLGQAIDKLATLGAGLKTSHLQALAADWKVREVRNATREAMRLQVVAASEPEPDGRRKAVVDTTSVAWGMQHLLGYKCEAHVKAAMWDPETKRWYLGKCGHGIALGTTNVPAGIAEKIGEQKVDNSDFAFGPNCAEVHCVIKAYGKGKKAADLTGCIFIAHMKTDGFVGPCKTCKAWIPASKGTCHVPKK